MSKRLWGACLALGMGCAFASGPRSEAKPPDLPVHPQVTCPEGRVTDGSFSDHENGAGSVGAIPDLSWLGGLFPPMADPATTGQGSTQPELATTETSPRENQLDRYRQAQRIYLLGLSYQQDGNLSKARTCFQEAHLVSPDTRYGKLAIERLHHLETERHSGIEEAEPVDVAPNRRSGASSREQFENIRRTTTPLGTVPMESY